MSTVSVCVTMPAAAAAVWQRIGGFNSLPDWCGAIRASVLEDHGRVRRLEVVDGSIVVERLETFSEAERSYSYSIVEAALPVTNYLSTLKVIAVFGQAQSIVEWSSNYYTAPELEERMRTAFTRLYQDSLDNLKLTLSA